MSDSFVQSGKARDVEFTTNADDRPLIVQFAATNAVDFAGAAELVAPFADGIDLNCGCPQRWALSAGYGAALIKQPELVADMVQQARTRSNLPISIKIRIHCDISQTVELCRRAESAGCAWITVHGRTTKQRAEPCNVDAIRTVKESVRVPVVANGDIRCEDDIHRVAEMTGVDGVMSARGILENPAMFAGHPSTPPSCIQDWVDTTLTHGLSHTLFHHHLIHMLERVTTRVEKRVFNTLPSIPAVLDYLRTHYGIT